MCDRAGMPIVKVENLLCYEDLLSAASPDYTGLFLTKTTPHPFVIPRAQRATQRVFCIATDLRSSTHSPPARRFAGVHRSRFNLSRSAAVPCKCLGRPVRCCHVRC